MKQIKELSDILERSFGLQKSDEAKSPLSEEEYLLFLKQKLAQRILFYLRNNIEGLFQALYRIDVDDKFVNEAFDLGEIHLVSERIAQLIIDRQLQKLSYIYKFSK